MSFTKQQIIEEAFGELALHGNVVTLDPDTLDSGKRRLDMMLATWSGKGFRLGYPIPANPDDSLLDDDSNLPDWAIEPVVTNLAMRLAGGYGKQVSPTTAMVAKDGYDMLAARFGKPQEVPLPTSLPLGAGNKTWRSQNNRFISPPDQQIEAGPDGTLEFN